MFLLSLPSEFISHHSCSSQSHENMSKNSIICIKTVGAQNVSNNLC